MLPSPLVRAVMELMRFRRNPLFLRLAVPDAIPIPAKVISEAFMGYPRKKASPKWPDAMIVMVDTTFREREIRAPGSIRSTSPAPAHAAT